MAKVNIKMIIEIEGEREDFRFKDGNVMAFQEMIRAVADTIHKPNDSKSEVCSGSE